MKKLLLCCYFFILVGCAAVSTPLATPDMDMQAKLFEVPEGKSQIYIFRDEGMGFAVGFKVSLNDVPVGTTGAKTYFRFILPPGEYTIDSFAENTSTLTIQAEAGKNYFVWQEVKMGLWKARNELTLVSEERGRQGVLASKLMDSESPH